MTPEQMIAGLNGQVETLRKATRLDIAARLLAGYWAAGIEGGPNTLNSDNRLDRQAREWALSQAELLMKENEAMP